MKKDTSDSSKFLYELIFGCGFLMIVVFLGILIAGENFLPDERTYTDMTYIDYNDGWSRIYSDGTVEAITPPTQVEPEKGQNIVISKTIETADAQDLYISFDSAKQDIYVYIDDELRYNYSTKDTRPFGKSSPGAIMFIPIHPTDDGKVIKIVFSGDNNYTGVIGSMILGTQYGVVHSVFEKEGWKVVCALFIMILGAIAFLIGVFIKVVYEKSMSLLFAGWLVNFAGLWALSESSMRQFLVPNFSLFSNMTYLSIIMIPFAEALYFDCLQRGKFRVVYMLACVLDIVLAIIGLILQFTEQADLVDTLFYSMILIVFCMAFFLATSIRDFIDGSVKEYWPEYIGIIGAIITGIYQMIEYLKRPTTVDGKYVCYGLLFLISMSYIRALRDIRNLELNMYAAVHARESSAKFLTRMSHEMRTPINAILGMNKMILRESKEENILDYARDVNSAGDYLLGVVNEVLDLSKVTAGKVILDEKEYDVINMVRECYAMVRPRAKANRLAFEVDMSDVLPSVLFGDRDRVIQIITNLLTNAVKYTPTGRVTLTIDGKISEGKLLLMVAVSDTGIGIEKENIPYLFDSFERVGEFDDNRIEGTGLGLTITKQLVNMMGGTISVESEFGKGSIFTVIIPQGIRSVEPCGQFSMGPNGDRRVADRNEVYDFLGKILVVDDVAINLRVFTVLLKDTDLKLEYAKSGQEALEKMRTTKYDLIFMDHLMPGIDGVQVKKIMDAEENNPNRDTPIIMQTANAVVGAQEEYEEIGFTDYIAKPIKEEELHAILKKYL